MAMVGIVASTSFTYHKPRFAVVCRKNKDGRERERERDREKEHKHPFKVVEITPPPRCLGVRCFPTQLQPLAVLSTLLNGSPQQPRRAASPIAPSTATRRISHPSIQPTSPHLADTHGRATAAAAGPSRLVSYLPDLQLLPCRWCRCTCVQQQLDSPCNIQ
ncbi:uncharacterized protein LOC120682168 isoform X1 [Panicum virgatum]|uniref:uncharacterized protein LOC120682168 isoform X1 n=1 Tax=Panicum virgatum TaxID=38727 RepID=UPI0019D65770|nr:uncharacterized protein LOC120682168 isoform X1 [Panicum virgatum]